MSGGLIDVKLEAAFGSRWWTDLSDPSVTWTDLTDRLIGIDQRPALSVRLGRTDVMQRAPQPSTMDNIVLDSSDGALSPDNTASPYYPDVMLGFPIRCSILNGTTWVRVFTGFASSITPVAHNTWTEVDVSAADGWARVMQAGERINLRDRLLRALNMGYPLSAILDPSVPREVFSNGSTESALGLLTNGAPQAWGVGWWELVPYSGLLPWSAPGAGSILAECGGPDQTPNVGVSIVVAGPTSLFASDRFGGSVTRADASASSGPLPVLTRNAGWNGGSGGTAAYTNLARQQVAAGRPPTQLLPASICDPTSVAGWTATSGAVSRVAASSLSWVPTWDSFDPITGARSSVVTGPAGAIRWTGPAANAVLTSPLFPIAVAAGKVVAVQAAASVAGTAYVEVDFFDASGVKLSGAASIATSSPGGWYSTNSSGTVPAGATQAQIRIQAVSGVSIELHSLGLYIAELIGSGGSTAYAAPARWYAPGDDAHLNLYVQAPLDAATAASYGFADGGSSDLWLFGEVAADAIGDGSPHQVAWNLIPGVTDTGAAAGQRPAVWVDNIEAAVTWHVSRTPNPASGPRESFWTVYGSSSGYESWRVTESVGNAAALVSPVLAITALTAQFASITGPSASLIRQAARWTKVPAVVTQPLGTTFGATDELVGTVLDAVGWPETMRDLHPGRTTAASLSWASTPDDADSANLGDYASTIGDLATGEYGWADVDGSGTFRWLPRGWYDPDGDGITAVTALLTWRSNVPGWTTYMAPLGQAMNEDHACNVVTASYAGAGVPARYLIDEDSVEHLGVREQQLDNAAWSTQDIVDEVAAEVLALSKVTVLPQTITLVALGADDPMVDVILGLSPADTVVVEVPRAPADDLVTTAILEQIALSTDGITLTATLTLAPCPAAGWALKVFPGANVFPALDLYPMGA